MLAVTRAAIRTARQPTHACRIIAGVRRSIPARTFHSSYRARQIPEDPRTTVDNTTNGKEGSEELKGEDPQIAKDLETEAEAGNGTSTVTQRGRAREGYGSAAKRALRNRAPKELPPVSVPAWFKEVNVVLHENNVRSTQESSNVDLDALTSTEVSAAGSGGNTYRQLHGNDDGESYTIQTSVYKELLSTCRASLGLRPPDDIDLSQIPRPDTVLFCPRPEGIRFLDHTVRTLASHLEADLLVLDPDSLAEVVGGYLGENIAWSYANTSLLGYEVHKISGRLQGFEAEETDESLPENEDPEESEDGEHPVPDFIRKLRSTASGLRSRARGVIVDVSSGSASQPMSLSDFWGASAASGSPAPSQANDAWADLKMTAALETLVDAAISKRIASDEAALVGEATAKDSTQKPTIKGLIVQVCNYKELDSLSQGQVILKKLREVVKRRWHDGLNVTILGTTTTEVPEPSLSRNGVRLLQSEITKSEYRTIIVPSSATGQFLEDEQRYTSIINYLHICEMTRNLGKVETDVETDPEVLRLLFSNLPRKIYDYGYVYRIAFALLGSLEAGARYTTSDIRKAMETVATADSDKFESARDYVQGEISHAVKPSETSDIDSINKLRMSKLKKDASRHEKKLLGGIVQAPDINTSFADIRAPSTTVEALKTLTSLSLQRPDAFKYGILATQKIPGILLYGPPGTGKTMLAKAVAKESGATVLEVSGSEMNDMYVGEGEKNVKALFSLAKKLSPCVIFIDEADGIFASRGGDSAKRTSHRELINQFLRELDGMTEFTGILMVATNRPFDLDEAVLRRLPRRILVDLPIEQDREAILRLHLAEEILDSTVDVGSLAKDTPLYSGSDLKNLSVAAALACVKEENDAASKHGGHEAYQYPVKRVLTKAHFDKAMEEISASISEDMSTLKAIRKFDERYGDRKGRKKKAAALGFGDGTAPENDSEAGRVRKVPALVV